MKYYPLLVLLTALAAVHAQDDNYVQARFVNQSAALATVTIRNPRDESPPRTWKVEAGKTLLLADGDGKPVRIGEYSSFVRVGEVEKPFLEAAAKGGEDRIRVITWTAEGFKPVTR